MNPKFKEILDALKEGDLDKLSRSIFLASLQPDINYNYIIPGKPLFVTAEVQDMENNIIKRIVIDLYYPGWKLEVELADNEDSVSFSYVVYQSRVEGVYVHD